ncbi:mitochondrial ornithine transporter 1-like [Pocillopora verrucosa]|uniref:mitochondrial ornithine transporter 1-like n=1 Tax=Pocillopora verrucosa TaxID=203993 RepID=UPI00333F6659
MVESPSAMNVDLSVMKRMVKDFTAGAIGGTACVMAGQPFDTIKVKMQTFPSLFKTAFDCGVKTLKQEGFRGLYAGTIPSLAANIAENSVLFLFYGQCLTLVKKLVGKKDEKELSILNRAFAGSGAAVFSSFALCPTELVKCRLQAQHQMNIMAGKTGAKSGVVQVTMQIIREDGFLGLFRGMTSTLVREVPGYFFFFGGYELSRYFLTPEGKTVDDLGAVRLTFCGGIAGVSLWIAIFPADVIKSRIQILTQGSDKVPGFFETMFQIVHNEGPRALYKGLGPTLVRCFPACGALFVAYEGTQKLLENV